MLTSLEILVDAIVYEAKLILLKVIIESAKEILPQIANQFIFCDSLVAHSILHALLILTELGEHQDNVFEKFIAEHHTEQSYCLL